MIRIKTVLLALLFMPSLALSLDWKERIAAENLESVVKLEMYGLARGTYPVGGTCSGAYVDEFGGILTAAHCFMQPEVVITTITVTTFNNETYAAKAFVIDSSVDLGFLFSPTEVASWNIRPAKVAPLRSVRVGMDVLAIGHPYGLDWTVTYGIVSHLFRKFEGALICTQFDSVIAPGSSGGPVFDRQGRIIGVVSMYRSGIFGSLTGLNFMIHLKSVHNFLNRVKTSFPRVEKKYKRYKIKDVL